MTAPGRIVSLVPSLTELVIDLGLAGQLVGRTRFCIHPEEQVGEIPIVGGTKNPRLEKIIDLKPDLVIANKEENRKEDIRQLQAHCRVIVTEISTVKEALLAIYDLGMELNADPQAKALTKQIGKRLDTRPAEPSIRTAYFIWRDPWMTVGGDTYIHDVMRHWGLTNVYGARKRYPEVDLNRLAERNPELILLSSEPYPFREKHIEEIQRYSPDSRILLVDGEWFSWYGSRMLHAFEQLNTWREAIA